MLLLVLLSFIMRIVFLFNFFEFCIFPDVRVNVWDLLLLRSLFGVVRVVLRGLTLQFADLALEYIVDDQAEEVKDQNGIE